MYASRCVEATACTCPPFKQGVWDCPLLRHAILVFFLSVIGANVRVWGDGRQSGAAAETVFIDLVRIVPNE
ncbi:hypothetical protein [Planctomycetes bacterium TBK1r]|uniref:hypothetical protein n=1 Tax=Stieleria magnilauensis TaxID=2527963 RepID=UPI00119FBDF2